MCSEEEILQRLAKNQGHCAGLLVQWESGSEDVATIEAGAQTMCNMRVRLGSGANGGVWAGRPLPVSLGALAGHPRRRRRLPPLTTSSYQGPHLPKMGVLCFQANMPCSSRESAPEPAFLQSRMTRAIAQHRPDLLMAISRKITPAPPDADGGQVANTGRRQLHPSLHFVVSAAGWRLRCIGNNQRIRAGGKSREDPRNACLSPRYLE